LGEIREIQDWHAREDRQHMNKLLQWIDQRSGLLKAVGGWFLRPVAGGPRWRFVWPSTIAFGFVVEAITGFALWMYYSPGAQSAWESVYYLQYRVPGGWLLRAIHHYTAQVMLVLIGLYLLQIIFRAAYRAPREVLFWTVLLMGLVTLGLNLTGDLLAWDQNGYWSTHVRTGFLFLLPGVGEGIHKLAVGGPEMGTLTLTRFLALHIGLFTAALLALIILHAWLARRHGLEDAGERTEELGTGSERSDVPVPISVPYWPRQMLRDMVACAVVMAAILALSLQHGVIGLHAGVELGAPADTSEDPGTARPEWSFRGLFQFRELFPSNLEILPIFVVSGLTVLVFFGMPFWGASPAGRIVNSVLAIVVLAGLAILSWQSYAADARSEKYATAAVAGRQQADRAKELAASEGIPAGGALTLLRHDPQTQGPRLFRQFCACCHDYSDLEAGVCETVAQPPTAPNLYGFAGRRWIAGLLDPKQVGGPKYFGNTKFRKGQMVDFVTGTLSESEPKDVAKLALAVSAEAALKSQQESDAEAAADIAEGRKRLAEDCTDCHTFHGKGTAKGPELTGYGNRQWLIGIISDPGHKRFYGKRNDPMPAYAPAGIDPTSHILTDRQVELLADWLRGE
jgi:ubiquinol-cytochrome c reductase cytochrome b subunit